MKRAPLLLVMLSLAVSICAQSDADLGSREAYDLSLEFRAFLAGNWHESETTLLPFRYNPDVGGVTAIRDTQSLTVIVEPNQERRWVFDADQSGSVTRFETESFVWDVDPAIIRDFVTDSFVPVFSSGFFVLRVVMPRRTDFYYVVILSDNTVLLEGATFLYDLRNIEDRSSWETTVWIRRLSRE